MFEDEADNPQAPKELPIYKKGLEIVEVVQTICELILEDNEILRYIGNFMMTDTMTLTSKVMGAESGDLYDIRIECATFIRKAANNLIVQNIP